FSSRRRHTRCYRDWSSDVCSSDLYMCLEGAHAALLFASGEAAAGAFFQALMPGAVLAPRNMYWALRKWLLDFAKPRGLAVEFYEIGRASCRERGESVAVACVI